MMLGAYIWFKKFRGQAEVWLFQMWLVLCDFKNYS
jgi:hypothetical protein